jgi:hypothetical protein
MIKKIALLAALFVSFSSVVQADFSLSQWQYQKDILNVQGGLIDVSLDNEVFANSAKNLTDVRVVDGTNREVPYKLITAKSEESKQEYHPKITNNSAAAGKYTMAIMDMGKAGAITNSLTVKTPSENFQRNVVVYGSDDSNSWNILRSDAYIYDYTYKKGNAKSQNTQVSFPDSTFRFLKIEISDAENNPVAISSITVNQLVKKNAQEFNMTTTFETFQDASQKTTSLLADLGQSGIPTSKIALTIDGNNFNRGVAVYSSGDKNSSSWKAIGQGYIFRYNTPKFSGENTTISINESTDRYIKIVVNNNDDAPLVVSQIKALATIRELVFQAEAGSAYRMFYGNPKSIAPSYDFEKYFQYLDLSVAHGASLGSQKINPAYVVQEQPLTERSPWILTVGLVVGGVLLLFMVYKFLKN